MEFLKVLMLIVVGGVYFFMGYATGRSDENKRIMSCYNSSKFSGFVWLDDSPYFTCEDQVKKGRVIYNEK